MERGEFPIYTLDSDLIAAVKEDNVTRVRIVRHVTPMVVLGSGSREKIEIDLDACRAENVPVLRRQGGGCAVLLDPGNVIVSVVATGLPFGQHRQQFDVLTEWLIDGLNRIGILGVMHTDICDLALDDRKVGGACLYRSRDLLYYSVSLLVEPNMELVTQCLKHPPREPEYRRGRSHASFMGSLDGGNAHGAVKQPLERMTPECVAGRLRDALAPPVFSVAVARAD
ncbi:MAG: hypothetical protein KAS72_05060 [Phycisphaerales bacterium]|nr:hypothetical protein [Phycisphaerales bacterium]